MAPPLKVLLTGATGYIGGSVLHHLLTAKRDDLVDTQITCMVRGRERAAKLEELYGSRVKAALFRDLSDTDLVFQLASQHDVVINMTPGYHLASATAFIKGLAERKRATGREVWLIHTSGTSNLADQYLSKTHLEPGPPGRVFDDSKDDIYSYEKQRNAKTRYIQRTSEIGIIDAGLAAGVKTIVIMSPLIYGIGTGAWNKSSLQIPGLVRAAIYMGQPIVVGDGKGTWDHVHIDDLADLYGLVLLNVLRTGGKDLPHGKKGIVFSSNGRHTWMEVSQGVADAAHEAGKVRSREIKAVSLEEGAKLLTGGHLQLAELGFASNSRTESKLARKLGWRPKIGAESWQKGFAEEVKAARARTESL